MVLVHDLPEVTSMARLGIDHDHNYLAKSYPWLNKVISVGWPLLVLILFWYSIYLYIHSKKDCVVLTCIDRLGSIVSHKTTWCTPVSKSHGPANKQCHDQFMLIMFPTGHAWRKNKLEGKLYTAGMKMKEYCTIVAISINSCNRILSLCSST